MVTDTQEVLDALEIDYDLDWMHSALTANDHSQLTEMFFDGFFGVWNHEDEELVPDFDDEDDLTPPEDEDDLTPPEDEDDLPPIDDIPLPPIDLEAPAARTKGNTTQWNHAKRGARRGGF